MKSVVLILCAFLQLSSYAAAEERQFTLIASTTGWEVAPGRTVPAYTYNGTVPGPVLRGKVGDTFRITLANNLPVATTIHWHDCRYRTGWMGCRA
jgi:FtsP/CotA-like multicopper oxidase with cupredoxin domain